MRLFRWSVAAFLVGCNLHPGPAQSQRLGSIDLARPVGGGGDEPVWRFRIEGATISILQMRGNSGAYVRFDPAQPRVSGRVATYRTRSPEGLPTTLTLTFERCRAEGRQDEPVTALLQIGDRSLRGCADAVPILGTTDLSLGLELVGDRFRGFVNDERFGLSLGAGADSASSGARQFFVVQSRRVSGGRAVYTGSSEDGGARISATITSSRCRSGGASYPLAALISVGRTSYRGCAGPPNLPAPSR
jgi:uncharacterized membrane protein